MTKFVQALAAFGVAGSLCISASGGASASTFTIGFTGEVTQIIDAGGTVYSDPLYGQTITGTLSFTGNAVTYNNPPDGTPYTKSLTTFDQVAWNFSIAGGAVTANGTYTPAQSDTGTIGIGLASALAGTDSSLTMTQLTGPDAVGFDFFLSFDFPIASLGDVPASGVPSFFGSGFASRGLLFGDGRDYWAPIDSYSVTENSFAPLAATSVPPALPLFAAGLGGMGLLGWHRRRAA
jgi:hypothetical protein